MLSLLAIGVVLIVKDMMQKTPPSKPRVQMVTLFVPPPPRIEQPPEPEIQKQEVKMQEVEQTPEAPPPGSDLGVDADGNGADNFNLKARKGGRGLLDGGPFGWYAARLISDIDERLSGHVKLTRSNDVRNSVLVRLWIARDGRIQRFEIVEPSRDRKLDVTLRAALAQMQRVAEPPPEEMPQPVQLRMVARL